MYIDIVIDSHQKSGNRQIGVCRFIALTRRCIFYLSVISWAPAQYWTTQCFVRSDEVSCIVANLLFWICFARICRRSAKFATVTHFCPEGASPHTTGGRACGRPPSFRAANIDTLRVSPHPAPALHHFYVQMCLELLRGGRLAQKRRGVDHKMGFNLPERENQLMYCVL